MVVAVAGAVEDAVADCAAGGFHMVVAEVLDDGLDGLEVVVLQASAVLAAVEDPVGAGEVEIALYVGDDDELRVGRVGFLLDAGG